MSQVRCSAVLAAYNGSDYINDQLRSILRDLGPDDECIVVDDCSTDLTRAIVESIDDRRLRLVVNKENIGHVRSFERGIAIAKGAIIALADQDDVWPSGRTDALWDGLQTSMLAVGALTTFGKAEATSVRMSPGNGVISTRRSHLAQVLRLMRGRLPYYGSAMAFRRELVLHLLPIPSYVTAHDHWIGLAGHRFGEVSHLNDVVVLRRMHESNLTRADRTLAVKLRYRVTLVRMILQLEIRLHRDPNR